MSDTSNPYQSPETAVDPVKPLVAQGVLTETMLVYLKQASPWLRFVGILGFIQCGFTVLGGFFSFAMVPLREIWRALSLISGFEGFSSNFIPVFGGAFGVYLLVAAFFTFFPSYFAYTFGSKIRSYLQTGAEKDLEKALKSNKSLWKFIGVLVIVGLAFIPMMLIITIIVAVVSYL
jgi:hypothetical protein